MCLAIITYLNVVRQCDCSCADQEQQDEVERDGDGVGKQEQRFFHPPSYPSSPPILFLLLFVLLLFLSFIFSYFSSSFLPFSSFYYVCFHHPSLNSLSPLSLSFQVVLPSQSPTHFCLWVYLSSDLSLVWIVISSNCSWLDFVTLHFVFVPRGLLILVSYRLNHKFREPLSQYISVTITRYFSKFWPPSLRVQSKHVWLRGCES